MKLENQVCSMRQAKKLKELGVIGAEFFLWLEVARFDKKGDIVEWLPALFIERSLYPECVSMLPAGCVNDDNEIMESRGNYPAFTVAELGQMLPDSVEDKQGTPFILEIGKAHYTYSVQYWDRCSSDTKGYLLPRTRDPLLAVCMADMLIVLLENNHITADEVNQRLTQ